MVKTKNKKRVAADVLTVKKSLTKAKKHNPFEVHTNKEKFSVLGRQLKHDKGMPGVSRAKALKRRKDTLGQEYLHKNKTNSFKDKRIGETTMSREEAASARFVAERLNQMKANKKQSLFNLNDEDILTHKGQTLEEIERFADTVSDDGDDDEEIGKLDAQYTGIAHFGGGGNEHDAQVAGRKTAIDDLIADQKRRKNEISKEKEEVSELTHRLDENWRSLIPLMSKMSKEDELKPKPDAYDRALREMIFEPRGAVSDKLKSESEIVKKDKEQLEKLERERLERMHGVTDEEKKIKHRSADDLDDGYFLQPVQVEKPALAYAINGKKEEDGNEDDNDTDEEFENGQKSGSDDEDESGEEEEESESDEDDDLMDLKKNEESDEEVIDKSSNKKQIERKQKPQKKQTEEDRIKMMKKAAAELPYTFELPDSYDELTDILKNRNAEFQSVILERMIKCNHPKIVHENKSRMITLFGYLLQHVNDTFELTTQRNVENSFRILDRLCPFLYDLSQINPAETTKCFQEVIKEKQKDYRQQKSGNKYPPISVLAFLKLSSNLYSSSDFRHQVITPCCIFISQMLSRCKPVKRSDIASGLFLVTIILEYTQLSKRLLPAALNFLVGVIFLCVPKRSVQIQSIVPPFKSIGEQNSLLVLTTAADNNTGEHLKSSDLLQSEIDDNSKIRLLNVALRLTTDMLTLLQDNIGAQYFTAPIVNNIEKLNLAPYPEFLVQSLDKLKTIISVIEKKPLIFITAAVKRPKALRMLEPKFEKVYDDKRSHKAGNKDKIVREGMIRKIKSETRGAIREIRRDTAFLAKIQLKQQMQSDAERKEKVKRIFSEASIQQGELNALDRKKKHM